MYKVRSLLSTRLGNDGAERVLISQKSLKKAAEQYATQKRKVGSLVAQGGKQLLKGEYYVIKEVDVDGLTEQQQLEAINEIEKLQECEYPTSSATLTRSSTGRVSTSSSSTARLATCAASSAGRSS